MVEDFDKDLLRMKDKALTLIKEKTNEIDKLKQFLVEIDKIIKTSNQSNIQKNIVESEDTPLEPVLERMTSKEAVRKLLTGNPEKYFDADEVANYLKNLNDKGVISISATPKTAAYNTLQKLGADEFTEKKVESGRTKYSIKKQGTAVTVP